MSEYFNVTTDYILKGIEPTEGRDGKSNAVASKILYVASTAFIVIGLLCAFSGWYEDQSAEAIWGSMIIQAVGVAGYFIGRIISREKAAFIINWLNIIIILFMPISLIVANILHSIAAPYPTDIISGGAFAVVYIVAAVITFAVLKKQAK
jgi:hypothetical protein